MAHSSNIPIYCLVQFTPTVFLVYLQHLSAMVERGDLHGQTRALRTLAGIYEETHQMTKAEHYYRKVSASSTSK